MKSPLSTTTPQRSLSLPGMTALSQNLFAAFLQVFWDFVSNEEDGEQEGEVRGGGERGQGASAYS